MADERNRNAPRDPRRPDGQPGEIDPDAPPSAEEIAASQRLRDALEDPSVPNEQADLARSLRAAWSPSALDDDAHGAIVDETLSPEEVRAAAELRDALDANTAATPEAELARALGCAWNPAPLSDAEHQAIIARAIGTNVVAFRRRSVVVRVSFGMAGVLAIAASVLFVIRQGAHGDSELPLALARSTQPLFTEPFRSGDASARIDRIALARASDFRDNRFAKWGVR
jgi:hypothetical protein